MNQKIIIEKVKEENFDEFLKLVEKLADYEKQELLDKQVKQRLKKDALSENPRYEGYLAKLNDKYVGYMIFFMSYSSYLALPTLYLEDIFILEEYRRKGFGQKMFKFCIEKAKENNCGRMEWCAFNWNKTAHNFYKKIKANPLDKTYYRFTKEEIENFSD